VEVLNGVLARYGKALISLAQYRSHFGFPVQDFYRQLGFDFSVDPYDAVADDYIELYRKRQVECRLQAGAPEVLDHCLRSGLTQSILSAYHQDLLTEIVQHFGLTSFFVRLAGRRDHFAASKVAEGHRLIRDLGLVPSQTLLVGDTLHDREVAQDLGVDCVLIGRGHQDPDRLRGCGVPVLDCLHQVPALLSDRQLKRTAP